MTFLDAGLTTILLWGTIGYLLGSIPSGIILARIMNLGNLRDIGSGNIGATNVLRTGNKKAAALTLLFDATKGAVAVLLARYFANEAAAQVAAIAALIGHCLPIWLKFKGGKGVATYFGIIFALAWPFGFVAAFIWLTVVAISRYSSLAALLTVGWMPVVMLLTGNALYFLLTAALGLIVYVRHWENIKRLREKTETKVGSKG